LPRICYAALPFSLARRLPAIHHASPSAVNVRAPNALLDAFEMLAPIRRTKTPKLMQYCITYMSATPQFAVVLVIYLVQYSRILEFKIDVAQVFKIPKSLPTIHAMLHRTNCDLTRSTLI
jgi:hypothetical protein